jgi:hypothetical protein
LDRNLGAPNAPTGFKDYANYGDLFQWGRGADGHQLFIRPSTSADPTPVNTTTTSTLSITDTPGHNNFIKTSAAPNDWRATANNNLWQGVNGINNPCPKGWRIPTIEEWTAEQLTKDGNASYTQLKLTNTGIRYNDGSIDGVTYSACYWSSSTAVTGNGANLSKAVFIYTGSAPFMSDEIRGQGMAVRCIKPQ